MSEEETGDLDPGSGLVGQVHPYLCNTCQMTEMLRIYNKKDRRNSGGTLRQKETKNALKTVKKKKAKTKRRKNGSNGSNGRSGSNGSNDTKMSLKQ